MKENMIDFLNRVCVCNHQLLKAIYIGVQHHNQGGNVFLRCNDSFKRPLIATFCRYACVQRRKMALQLCQRAWSVLYKEK